MSKRLIALLLILLGVLVYRFFIYEPCTPPTDEDMGRILLSCSMTLDNKEIRTRACMAMKEKDKEFDVNCDLRGQGPLILNIIKDMLEECSDKVAESEKLCKFKIPSLL